MGFRLACRKNNIYYISSEERKNSILYEQKNKDNENIDEAVDLQRYIDNGKLDNIPKVKEGDTVVVYKKFFSWKVFLQFVRDALVLFTAYHVFTGSK